MTQQQPGTQAGYAPPAPDTGEGWGGEPVRVDTKAETDRKCPACGGTMDFDPGTGGLNCPYCGHRETIEAVGTAQELDFNTAEQTASHDWGAAKKTVICKSCGAQMVYDALAIAGDCPYCGSNQVMEAQGSDSMAPGGVCVFRLDAKQAAEQFHGWIKRKIFCPRLAKQKAKPKSFQGVYLPFWTFDAQTHSDYTGRYGIDHTTTDSKGNEHTTTKWRPVSGSYEEFIDDQLVAASTQHNAKFLKGIEPFETADNVAYRPEYVAGFGAERYSVGLKDGWEAAKNFIHQRIERSVRRKIKWEKNADHVEIYNLNIRHSNVTFKYLLLPVWMSAFKWKEKVYNFMVNGQTGKVEGSTPISPWRVAIAVALGLALLALIGWVIAEG